MNQLDTHVQRVATVSHVAAEVPDPELVVVTLGDLGIVRRTAIIEDVPHVMITPTYSGCPAMAEISRSIIDAVRAAGLGECVVGVELAPPWTTDWITDRGRQRLHAAGIAPPSPAGIPVGLATPPRCPRCGSLLTRPTSRFGEMGFGATLCKANYQCQQCHEIFEYFKPL